MYKVGTVFVDDHIEQKYPLVNDPNGIPVVITFGFPVYDGGNTSLSRLCIDVLRTLYDTAI